MVFSKKRRKVQMLAVIVGFVFQISVIEDELSQGVGAVTIKLVLDQDEETKKPLVQVHRNLVRRLAPHQVDGWFGLFLVMLL